MNFAFADVFKCSVMTHPLLFSKINRNSFCDNMKGKAVSIKSLTGSYINNLLIGVHT